MSPFMSSMPPPGLIEMPPGIEHHALADEGDGLVGRLAAVPAHDHDPAAALGALADAEQRPHAELLHRLLVEDLDLDAELGEGLGRSANSSGPSTFGGSLTRSRARITPSATPSRAL